MIAEIFHALVLESHAVQHTLRSLSHARIVITLTRLQGGSLYDDATDFLQWHEVCKFQTIAEGSRCRHHWILQFQLMYVYT